MISNNLKQLEDNLWRSADTLRANSGLKASEYATPILGLIFLKFADNKYRHYEKQIEAEYERLKGTRREKAISAIALATCGFYLPDHARYDYLLNLPEAEDIAQKIKEAMQAIEQYKPELKGVLPQDEYFKLVNKKDKSIPSRLLKNFSDIPPDADGDMFGQIYEYFLGNFALAEGQGGGEFFTPRSVVRLMVEIIEPYEGTVFDPACGSGGMFVQSAQFVQARLQDKQQVAGKLYVYGQEKTLETVKLAKMNIAVNGLRGDVRQTNSYYDDPFGSLGKFDYVLANPPFNVDDVNYERVAADKRFNLYGVPRKKTRSKKKKQGNETVPNANYLWINLFASSLKENGRAALVMANSASDARHSEADIRRKLIEDNLIYGMLTLPSNMFYTVTLPATLWFFDKNKQDERILFIDARNIFTQIDRAHREFSAAQINNIAIISRLHRGERTAFLALIDEYFAQGAEKLAECEAQLNAFVIQCGDLLNDEERQALTTPLNRLTEQLASLQQHAQAHQQSQPLVPETTLTLIDAQNQTQQALAAPFKPLFAQLRATLKQTNKTLRQQESQKNAHRALRASLEQLQQQIKHAATCYQHIDWLQERFPHATYEDVTGLCKLATLAEIKAQDYSLNAGRYVGVVIEEDGKTEEEFLADLQQLNAQLERLNAEARVLEGVIAHNVREMVGGG